MQAYCVKCRAKKEMKNPVKSEASGRASMKGQCSTCGTKMNAFLPKEKKSGFFG